MNTESFAIRHIGVREEDLKKMLEIVGVETLDELIEQAIPSDILLGENLNLPEALSEPEFLNLIEALSKKKSHIQILHWFGISRKYDPFCHKAKYFGESGMVYGIYPIPGRNRARAVGGPSQFSNRSNGFDGHGNRQCLLAG